MIKKVNLFRRMLANVMRVRGKERHGFTNYSPNASRERSPRARSPPAFLGFPVKGVHAYFSSCLAMSRYQTDHETKEYKNYHKQNFTHTKKKNKTKPNKSGTT